MGERARRTAVQTVAGFVQKGPGWSQLFLSRRKAGTTGASFVLLAQPGEGRLEVSVKLRGSETQETGGFSQGVPTPADRKRSWSATEVGSRQHRTPLVPPPPPPPLPTQASSSPNELEKHLVFCAPSVNIYWVGRCANTVGPSHRSHSPVRRRAG